MNKLYVFCALVFLTACGSPDYNGNWTSGGEHNFSAKEDGTSFNVFEEGEIIDDCVIKSPGETISKLECGPDIFTMTLNGDTLKVTDEDGQSYTFLRN